MHRRSRAPSPAVGTVFSARCMSATRMSWQGRSASTGSRNRWHSRRWVSCACDHACPAGCRSGARYQAIKSAPGRCRLGASVVSRTATLSSLAASRSCDTAWHCRRVPPSYHTARQRSPGERAGYTVIPSGVSITTRPGARLPGRGTPVTTAAPRAAARFPSAAALVRLRPAGISCGISVGILARAPVGEAIECLSLPARRRR